MREIILRAAIDNPLDGILPNFSIFGVEFNELWQKIIAAAWAIGMIISIVYIIIGITAMGQSQDGNPNVYKEGRKKALWALIAFGGLAALAVIVGAVLTFVG